MQHRIKPIKSPPLPFQTHNPITKTSPILKSILISMATLFTLSLFTFLLFFSFSSASRHIHKHASNSSNIKNACKASRDSVKCETFLSHVPQTSTAPEIIQSAISVSAENLKTGRVMVENVLAGFKGNENGTNAANNCLELLRFSEYRINLVLQNALPSKKIKDARAWMSSALVYQYDSWSALKYVNTSSVVGQTMEFLNNSLIASSSNALAMLFNLDVFGDNTMEWNVVRTERDGFWEPRAELSGSTNLGGVPAGLQADVIVCKDCECKSVQEAVNRVPDNLGVGERFVIWIKEGVYEEIVRVGLEKRNVVFLGDGIGKTIITGSMNVGQQGTTTYNSATVGVAGDGFMARDLTIQNTAGPVAHQAVAFRSDSDLSIIENCEFLGNQDTLYAHSLRQYYKSCRIQGNVDFIFGNSAAFFQDCAILVAPRQVNPEKGENNAVTAHGRIDPAQSTGFVFQNCVINGTDAYMALYYSKTKAHKTYLGRPWKQFSRTVFIRCVLEVLVMPSGWLPWDGEFALSTLYYGEFQNSGAGSNVSGRVSWSSQIPDQHVEFYSVQNFIQADEWMPTSQ